MRKKIAFPILLFVLSLLIVPPYAHAVTASSATLNFMCACGSCDEALSTCECPQSDDYRSQIAQMVTKGWSEQQIIEDFVFRYGESVLVVNAGAAPKTFGGNPVSTTRVGGTKSNTTAVFLIGFGAATFIFAGVKLFSSSKASSQKSRNKRSRNSGNKRPRNRSSKGRSRSRKDDDEYLLDD